MIIGCSCPCDQTIRSLDSVRFRLPELYLKSIVLCPDLQKSITSSLNLRSLQTDFIEHLTTVFALLLQGLQLSLLLLDYLLHPAPKLLVGVYQVTVPRLVPVKWSSKQDNNLTRRCCMAKTFIQ